MTRPQEVARLIFVAAIFALTGCANEVTVEDKPENDDSVPTFNGYDPTLSCPSDKVGWNFLTGGSSSSNARGNALTGIQIVSATWGSNIDPAFEGNHTRRAQVLCNGSNTCSIGPGGLRKPSVVKLVNGTTYKQPAAFEPDVVDPVPFRQEWTRTDFDVSYTCGLDAKVFSERIQDAFSEKVTLNCGGRIGIKSASFGANCNAALAGNATSLIDSRCAGGNACAQPLAGLFTSDPAPNCAKTWDISWTCSPYATVFTQKGIADRGQTNIRCTDVPTVKVISATYGGNCGITQPNVTAQLTNACAGKNDCFYTIANLGIRDPAPNCAKDYKATYTCGTDPTVLKAEAAGEAAGKTIELGCLPTPGLHIVSATYGGNGGVTAPNVTTPLVNACEGRPTCAYVIRDLGIIGDPAPNVAKEYTAVYSCGQDERTYTTTISGEAGGRTLNLTCAGANGQTAAQSLAPSGYKACVPKTCAWNMKRDVNMNCVPNPGALDISSYQNVAGFGNDNGLFRLGIRSSESGPAQSTLFQNGQFSIISTLTLATVRDLNNNEVVELTPWFTREFAPSSPGNGGVTTSGFLCALPPMAAKKPFFDQNLPSYQAVVSRDLKGVYRGPIPLSCFDGRGNPWADAALHYGNRLTEATLRTKDVTTGVKLHLSAGVAGGVGLKGIGETTRRAAPNPPGFFYDPARNYLDQIKFYSQTEVGVFGTDGIQLDKYVLAQPSQIEVRLDSLAVRNGAIALSYLDDLPASVNVDVGWTMERDWPLNPRSPTTTKPVPSHPTLTQLNMRAAVEIFPTDSPGSALKLGDIPLVNGSPTGTTNNRRLALSDAIRAQMMGLWSNRSSFSVRTCLDIDGQNTRTGADVTLPSLVRVLQEGSVTFDAKLKTSTCITQANAIYVSRTYTKLPLTPEGATSVANATDSRSSGDSRNNGTSDNGMQRACTAGANGSTVCRSTQRSTSLGGGDSARSYFSLSSAGSRTDESANGAAAVTGSSGATGEVLGYRVMDVADADNTLKVSDTISSPFSNKDALVISISPNWDLVVTTVRAKLKSNPASAAADVEKGRFAGQNGMGVGLGFRVPIASFGVAEIKAYVGVSLGLELTIPYHPEIPYPCINSTNAKCFRVLPSAGTQQEAAAGCANNGGRLAEMTTAADRTGILAAVNGNQNYWIGGQLGISFNDAACANNPTSTACQAASSTSYRWVGSNVEFAKATGAGVPLYDAAKIGAIVPERAYASRANDLATPYGIAMHGQTRLLTSQPMSNSFFGICEFEPAASTFFRGASIAIKIGAGAGVGVSFCTPSPDIGVCLEGQLNVVDMGISPTFGWGATDLRNSAGRKFASRGEVYIRVPWNISLLTGSVALTFNAFFFSISVPLFTYDGIRLAGGSLANWNRPYKETF